MCEFSPKFLLLIGSAFRLGIPPAISATTVSVLRYRLRISSLSVRLPAATAVCETATQADKTISATSPNCLTSSYQSNVIGRSRSFASSEFCFAHPARGPPATAALSEGRGNALAAAVDKLRDCSRGPKTQYTASRAAPTATGWGGGAPPSFACLKAL